MATERKLPARKKFGPFSIDTMPPGTRRRAEEENRKIRSRNKKATKRFARDTEDLGAANMRLNAADKAKKATKRFARDTEDLGAANMRLNAAKKKDANKRAKSTDGKSDKPSAASMRDSAAQRAALAKSEPKKESKPAKKAKVTGKGGRNVGGKANVTREQLKAAGVGLTAYLNKFDKLGRRPKPSDFKKAAPKKAAPKKDKPFNPVRPNQGGPGMTSIKPPKGPMDPMAAAAKLSAKGEDEMPIKRKAGGKMTSKMKAKGMKAGGKMKAKGMKAGGKMKAKGMAKGGMKTKGYMAGGLKDAPESNTGLKKLPKQVRNKMGFKAKGGMMKTKGMKAGGKMKAKGMAKGGLRDMRAVRGMRENEPSKLPSRERPIRMPNMPNPREPVEKQSPVTRGRGGFAKGGMKSKMSSKGGAKGGKKPTTQKVRGAGIARKGVRPAKMR